MTYLDTITTSLAAGHIYNADFQDVKHHASRKFEKARREAREPFFTGGRYQDRTNVERQIDDAIGFNLTQFPSKKLMKLLDNPALFRSPYVISIEMLIEDWAPVSKDLKALKGMVIKGRKPSETPRKTVERTLENTGTCSVCARNVKLNAAGQIVDHGFNIHYGFRSNQCPGVGYSPIEVSPAGMHAYLDLLLCTLVSNRAALMHLDRIEDVAERRKVEVNAERMIVWLEADIENLTKRIETWEPRPLPDAMCD